MADDNLDDANLADDQIFGAEELTDLNFSTECNKALTMANDSSTENTLSEIEPGDPSSNRAASFSQEAPRRSYESLFAELEGCKKLLGFKEAEVSDLNSAKESLSAALLNLQTDLDVATARIEVLEAEGKDSMISFVKLKEDRDCIDVLLKERDAELAETKAKLNDSKIEKEELYRTISELKYLAGASAQAPKVNESSEGMADHQIILLKNKIDERMNEIEKLHKVLDGANNPFEARQKNEKDKISEKDEVLEHAKMEKERLRSIISDKSSILEEREKELKEYKFKLEESRRHGAELKEQLKNAINNFEKRNSEAKELIAKYEKVLHEKDASEIALKVKMKSLLTIQKGLDDMRIKKDELENKVVDLETKLSTASKSIDDLKNKKEELLKNSDQQHDELVESFLSMDILKNENSNLSKKLAQKNDELTNSLQLVEKLQDEKETLAKDLKHKEKELAESSRLMEKKNQEMAELLRSLEEEHNESAIAFQSIEGLKKEKEELVRNLEEKKKELAVLLQQATKKDENRELSKSLEEMRNESVALLQSIEDLKKENEELTKGLEEKAVIQSKLVEKDYSLKSMENNAISDSKIQKEKLENTVRDLRDDLSISFMTIEDLKLEKQSMVEEVEKLRKQNVLGQALLKSSKEFEKVFNREKEALLVIIKHLNDTLFYTQNKLSVVEVNLENLKNDLKKKVSTVTALTRFVGEMEQSKEELENNVKQIAAEKIAQEKEIDDLQNKLDHLEEELKVFKKDVQPPIQMKVEIINSVEESEGKEGEQEQEKAVENVNTRGKTPGNITRNEATEGMEKTKEIEVEKEKIEISPVAEGLVGLGGEHGNQEKSVIEISDTEGEPENVVESNSVATGTRNHYENNASSKGKAATVRIGRGAIKRKSRGPLTESSKKRASQNGFSKGTNAERNIGKEKAGEISVVSDSGRKMQARDILTINYENAKKQIGGEEFENKVNEGIVKDSEEEMVEKLKLASEKEKREAAKRKEEKKERRKIEEREKEEMQRQAEEQKKKRKEEIRKEEEARKQEEEARKQEEEARKQEEEASKQEEEARKQEKEAGNQEEETRKKEEEARKTEEKTMKKEEGKPGSKKKFVKVKKARARKHVAVKKKIGMDEDQREARDAKRKAEVKKKAKGREKDIVDEFNEITDLTMGELPLIFNMKRKGEKLANQKPSKKLKAMGMKGKEATNQKAVEKQMKHAQEYKSVAEKHADHDRYDGDHAAAVAASATVHTHVYDNDGRKEDNYANIMEVTGLEFREKRFWKNRSLNDVKFIEKERKMKIQHDKKVNPSKIESALNYFPRGDA